MQNIFIGHGYDIHTTKPGTFITIGGIKIPCDIQIESHSDGDVLLHAISDAILGACQKNDIGYYFPNIDESIKNISSTKILQYAVDQIAPMCINNIDCTIIALKPNIKKYANEMKDIISDICKTKYINIKATTNEGIGALGSGDAIAAHAVVTLIKK